MPFTSKQIILGNGPCRVGDAFLRGRPGLSIAEYTILCFAKFLEGRKRLRHPDERRLLEACRVRRCGWTTDMDVLVPPNVSLDYQIRYLPWHFDEI